jgi:L-ascorbate metabolism protein UlaG (beta-lactamase superfamily)
VIRPLQSHDSLLADIHASDRRDRGFRLWWLGQSGFLLQWQGIHVLLDPYLSDSLTKKYSETETPHVRMTELVIDPARLSMADIVTSTHNHTDHLDAERLMVVSRLVSTTEPLSKFRGSDSAASHRRTKRWNAMSTVAQNTWDMFSNSAVGPFTTVVTRSGTKGCQRNCGLSE